MCTKEIETDHKEEKKNKSVRDSKKESWSTITRSASDSELDKLRNNKTAKVVYWNTDTEVNIHLLNNKIDCLYIIQYEHMGI